MLSYKEAERTLLNILNDYINEVEEKKIILELIESGSWKAAIYEIDKKKIKTLTKNDYQKLKEQQYDYLADQLRRHLDMDQIYQIMEEWK